MQCPKCAYPNRNDAKFCTKCGFGLPGLPAPANGPAVSAPPPPAFPQPAEVTMQSEVPQANIVTLESAVPSGTPYLEAVFTSGLRKGERVAVMKFPASVGRDPNSTLPLALNDTLASTRHAQILHDGTGFQLTDLGSTNGTYHQGNRIKNLALSHGDVIEFGIGGPKIRFEIPAAVATKTPHSPEDAITPLRPMPVPPFQVAVAPAPLALDRKAQDKSTPNKNDLPAWARHAPPPPAPDVPFSNLPSAPDTRPNEGESATPRIPVPPTQFPVPPLGGDTPIPVTLKPGTQAPDHPPQPIPPGSLPTTVPSGRPSHLPALLKLGSGLLLLLIGIGVAIPFGYMPILVGFMICVMLIGLGLMIWGALQLILGIPQK